MILDDPLALRGGHGTAIHVSDHVALSPTPAGHHPREQRRGDVAQRRGVVLARMDHEPVVAGCEGGIDAPGMIGRHEDRFSKARVASLRRPTVLPLEPGGIEGGHQAAEGTQPGQRPEPGRVTQPPQDLSSDHGTDARRRGEDPVG